MQLPGPKDFGWPKRRLEEATTTFTQQADGRIVMEVSHLPLPNVTAEMANWWFGVYAHQLVQFQGETSLAFLVWHPADHFHIARVGIKSRAPLSAGDRIKLSEAYARNPKYRTQEVVRVTKRDKTGYAVRAVRLGMTVADLEYVFDERYEGLAVTTRLFVGVGSGWAKALVNQLFVPLLFDERKTEAWMQHNVEEVGYWGHFLPQLYARREQGSLIQMDDVLKQV